MRLAALVLTAAMLTGCAMRGGLADDPTAALRDAQVTTRTEANGDVIDEYRVAGQLRVVRITPRTGVVHYLIDENGDGRLDSSRGEGPVSPVYYKLFEW
ncbi:MAG TPA: DUF2782 domain-containing protein [Lysobacter sp.]